MTDWSAYETDELASIYSDYHKDVYGFRPLGARIMLGRDAIIQGLQNLDMYMEIMKSTPEGRAQLREEGWIIEEPKQEIQSETVADLFDKPFRYNRWEN